MDTREWDCACICGNIWICFGEVDAGGVGFLSTTYSGEHNNLFANFGYVGIRGGLSLTF